MTDVPEETGSTLGDAAAKVRRGAKNLNATIDQVRDTVAETGQAAWDAAQDATARARDIASDATTQARSLAADAYREGEKAVSYVRGQFAERPVLKLVAAGAAGFLVGYLVHDWFSRSSRDKA